MYEELIKKLREQGNWLGYTEWTRDAFFQAADAIERQQTVIRVQKAALEALRDKDNMQGWIPVTVRLPDSGDKVIVAIRDESGDTKYDYTYCGWYSGYENKWIVDDEYCSWVTHWMSFPEPPKENENDE